MTNPPTQPLSASSPRSDETASLNAVAPRLRGLLATGSGPAVVVSDASEPARSLSAASPIVTDGPSTTDMVALVGPVPMLVEPVHPEQSTEALRTALSAFRAAQGCDPVVTVVPGVGVLATAPDVARAESALRAFLDLAGGVDAPATQPLPEVPAAPAASGRLAGRVALVTGAAQGFGLGITEFLLDEGASVVLADLNIDLARGEAERLASLHGRGRAQAVRIDVSDPDSCHSAVAEVVRLYGGIDLAVSNAGVLRAEGVMTQSVADFDLVTNVNYRGYFFFVRAVAPIMAAQHEADPTRWLDIVEVNSKSGLEGSKRNFAYAGSKFGGIGLTQSFALELVEHGIKVNAVCPGNFLDGPLWSDPERGLFVQYLRTGKVPGATTVDDVRRFYEAKVPMGRGCLPADVARAITYIVEQAYETGQAVPVTGGQTMLN